MDFPRAFAPDILRSAQKDAQTTSVLYSKLVPGVRVIATTVFGLRAHTISSPNVRRWLMSVAEAVYLAATVGAGIQTIGEEYSGIVQIDAKMRSRPSRLSQFIMIFIQCISPYAPDYIVTSSKRIVAAHGPSTIQHKIAAWILRHESTLRKIIPIASAVHLALFYLSGRVYEFSKRIMGREYVFTRALAVQAWSELSAWIGEKIGEEGNMNESEDKLLGGNNIGSGDLDEAVVIEPVIGASNKCIFVLRSGAETRQNARSNDPSKASSATAATNLDSLDSNARACDCEYNE
ncbi:peroxisome biogenesis factor 10 [Rhizoclosmatium sp. JEL0117]|nr:peroxisome biogenesis factor 10 [Rhizoclosmatium sp. JEL0117]